MTELDIRDSPELEPGPFETPTPATAEPPEKQPPIATCWVDGDPLVSTFAFNGYEFICLACGRLYGFIEPKPAEATPQLLELMHKRDAEFLPLARAILTPGMRRTDCELCNGGEDHLDHATQEEHAASDAAREKVEGIRQRVRGRQGG